MASKTDVSTYLFNHSMIRVKDPKETVKFFEFMGMKLLRKLEFPDAKYDLYFLAYDSPKAVSGGRKLWDREGVVELTHNYGTENDPDYKTNHGNEEPHRGFGHLCITVDHIQAACSRLEEAGYQFQKKLTDGRMKHIAFVKTPLDNYWVELIGQKPLHETESIKETDVSTYRMNHTMIRVKDAEKSLAFYQDVLGMTLRRTGGNPDAGFTLYFLSYDHDYASAEDHTAHEGVLELTWNHGTEKDAAFSYHSGNEEPRGFGHLAVAVDDIAAACARFESLGVRWKKRLADGRMKNIAFVLDPDDYWIEVVENERIAGRSTI